MEYKKLFRTAIVLTCFATAFCHSASADDPRYLSAYQSEYGLKLYNDGKIDLAVERFIKALLLDPENKTAKESLRRIGDEMTSTANPRALKVSRFIDQIEYFDFLDIRYRSLMEENKRLFEFAHNKSVKDPSFDEKIQAIQSRQTDHSVALPSVGIVGFTIDDNKSTDLDGIIASLTRERQLLVAEISFWEGQNKDLRSLRRSLLRQGPVETVATYKSQLEELKSRGAEKDSLLTSQSQNIEYFKTQLVKVRENFDTLQEKFKVTDARITELTKRIADMSMEILEKNKAVQEKESYATHLQKEIADANEKMNLVQRIIQEKDDRIVSLEKEMAQVHLAVTSESSVDGVQSAQLKADLKKFEELFKSQMEKNRDRIIGFEIQFTDLSQKYQSLVEDIQAKDSQIVLLKDDSKKKDVSIRQYREAFMTTNDKANELIGMVEIYRAKLAETKKSLIMKEEELRQMQKEITSDSLPAVPSSNQLNLSFSRDARSLTAVEGR